MQKKKINYINRIFSGKIFIFILITCFLICFMRNNFFCIDVFIPEPLDSYYLYEKPFEHNISKFCFSESLAALAVQFDEHSYKKPFYPKNFLGSVGYAYFEIFYNYLEEHAETIFLMYEFLKNI
jgi:hypothetical protein